MTIGQEHDVDTTSPFYGLRTRRDAEAACDELNRDCDVRSSPQQPPPRKCNFCRLPALGAIRCECDCLFHRSCYGEHVQGLDDCPVCKVPLKVRDYSLCTEADKLGDAINEFVQEEPSAPVESSTPTVETAAQVGGDRKATANAAHLIGGAVAPLAKVWSVKRKEEFKRDDSESEEESEARVSANVAECEVSPLQSSAYTAVVPLGGFGKNCRGLLLVKRPAADATVDQESKYDEPVLNKNGCPILTQDYHDDVLAMAGYRRGPDGLEEVSVSFSYHGDDHDAGYLTGIDSLDALEVAVPKRAYKPRIVQPLTDVVVVSTSNEPGITRVPQADHSQGEFGGPGDDGDLLVNFMGRNLELAVGSFKTYPIPKVVVVGNEAFQKVYAHYPPNFVGFSWSSGELTVNLPPSLVEPVCAFALTKLHDREGFEAVQRHVSELLYNVRCQPEWYRLMVEFTPFVAWYSVNNERLHGLQRYVDGEYWDCKRMVQTFGRCALCGFCLVLLFVVLGLGAYFTYAHFQ